MWHSVKAKAFTYLKMTMQGNSRKGTVPIITHTRVFHSVWVSNLIDLNSPTHNGRPYTCHTGGKPGPKTPNKVNPRQSLSKKMLQGPGKKAKSFPSSATGYDAVFSSSILNISGSWFQQEFHPRIASSFPHYIFSGSIQTQKYYKFKSLFNSTGAIKQTDRLLC